MSESVAKKGQLLLPMLGLIEQAELAVDELIDVMDRTTVETIHRRVPVCDLTDPWGWHYATPEFPPP